MFLRSFFWCGRWDLNPHVIDTRTSNVPVCRFQHFRIALTASMILPHIHGKSQALFAKIVRHAAAAPKKLYKRQKMSYCIFYPLCYNGYIVKVCALAQQQRSISYEDRGRRFGQGGSCLGGAAYGRKTRHRDRKSTRLNSSHSDRSRMPSSA